MCTVEAATLHCVLCTYVACVVFITAQCQNGSAVYVLDIHDFTVCVYILIVISTFILQIQRNHRERLERRRYVKYMYICTCNIAEALCYVVTSGE